MMLLYYEIIEEMKQSGYYSLVATPRSLFRLDDGKTYTKNLAINGFPWSLACTGFAPVGQYTFGCASHRWSSYHCVRCGCLYGYGLIAC